jgi:tRNA (Thr-GGU) A37 N-methylase
MAAPEDTERPNNIALIMVVVVGLAIVIITILTIMAIVNGAPVV